MLVIQTVPNFVLPSEFGFWHIFGIVCATLGIGKILLVLFTTKSTLWVKRVDELSELRESLQTQLKEQRQDFEKKFEAQEAKHAAATVKWEARQLTYETEQAAMKAKVEEVSRELWEEKSGRKNFEDKVLLIIQYQWDDKAAVNNLKREIESRRHGDKAAPKTKLRVLAVDDEADLLHLLKTALGTEGYEVATASSGAEALQQFVMAKDLGRPFSLVLLDFNMPFMAGDEVARELRARDQSVPILFLTAMDDNSFPSALLDEVDAVKATKPIELPKLLEKVAAVVG